MSSALKQIASVVCDGLIQSLTASLKPSMQVGEPFARCPSSSRSVLGNSSDTGKAAVLRAKLTSVFHQAW